MQPFAGMHTNGVQPDTLVHAAVRQPPESEKVIRSTTVATTPTQVAYLPIIMTPIRVGNITLRATPDSILANGQNTSQIIAQVQDAQGAPLSRYNLTFKTDQGLFPNNLTSITVQANTQGEARTSLKAPPASSQIVTATVRAEAFQPDGSAFVVRTEVRLIPVVPSQITVNAVPSRIPANGVSTTVVSATLVNNDDERVPDYSLTFNTTVGSFPDGSQQVGLTTDAQGVATTVLTSVLNIELVQARITVNTDTPLGPIAGVTDVDFFAPTNIISIATPDTIAANVNSSSNIVVTLQDDRGDAVPFFPVEFTTPLGIFANGSRALMQNTDQDGVVIAELRSEPQLGTADVNIKAGTLTRNSSITFVPDQCADIEPNNVPVEGKEQPSAVCTGSLQDDAQGEDDYYQVFLDPGQKIIVELTNIPAGADYDIILYWFDGTQVSDFLAFSNARDQEDERLEYTRRSGTPALHVIRVNMAQKSSSAQNTYRLRVATDPRQQPGVAAERPAPAHVHGAGASDPPLPAKE